MLPNGPRSFLFKQLLPSCKPLLATLREVATQRQVSMSAVAIAWAMSKGVVVIVGMKSAEQVKDNLLVQSHELLRPSPRVSPHDATQSVTATTYKLLLTGTHVHAELR